MLKKPAQDASLHAMALNVMYQAYIWARILMNLEGIPLQILDWVRIPLLYAI